MSTILGDWLVLIGLGITFLNLITWYTHSISVLTPNQWKSYLDQAGISAPVNSNLNYKEYYLEEKKFKSNFSTYM